MKRLLKLTDVSSAEGIPPYDGLDALAPGVRIRYGGRNWTVVSVDPAANRVMLED